MSSKHIIKYQYNNLTEYEIRNIVSNYLKNCNKPVEYISDNGKVIAYRCKCSIPKEDIKFLLDLTKDEIGNRNVNKIYKLAAIYGII